MTTDLTPDDYFLLKLGTDDNDETFTLRVTDGRRHPVTFRNVTRKQLLSLVVQIQKTFLALDQRELLQVPPAEGQTSPALL